MGARIRRMVDLKAKQFGMDLLEGISSQRPVFYSEFSLREYERLLPPTGDPSYYAEAAELLFPGFEK